MPLLCDDILGQPSCRPLQALSIMTAIGSQLSPASTRMQGPLCPQCALQGHQSLLRDANEDADGLVLCRRCGYVDQNGSGAGGGSYVKERDWYPDGGGSLEQLERFQTTRHGVAKTLRVGGKAVPGQGQILPPSVREIKPTSDAVAGDAQRRAQASFDERLTHMRLFVDNLSRHGALGDVAGDAFISREAWNLFMELYVRRQMPKNFLRRWKKRRLAASTASEESLLAGQDEDICDPSQGCTSVQLGDRAKIIAAACVAAVADQTFTRRQRERERACDPANRGAADAGRPINIARLEQFLIDATELAEDKIDLRKAQQDVLVRHRRLERSSARLNGAREAPDDVTSEVQQDDDEPDLERDMPMFRQAVQSAVDRLCFLSDQQRGPDSTDQIGKISSKDEIGDVLRTAAAEGGAPVSRLALDLIRIVKSGERAALGGTGSSTSGTRPDRRSHAPLVAAVVLAATEARLGRWHRHYAHILTEISDAVGCAKHTASERYLEVIAILQEWMEWLPSVGHARPIAQLAEKHWGRREQALPKRHLAILLLQDVVQHRTAILPYVRERYRRDRAGEDPLDPGNWIRHFLPQGLLLAPGRHVSSEMPSAAAPSTAPTMTNSMRRPSVLAPLPPSAHPAPPPDLGPGWSTTLPWDDPRLPTAPQALDDLMAPSKRVRSARKRKIAGTAPTADQAVDGVRPNGVLSDGMTDIAPPVTSVYARVRPSDERFYRIRRRGRAIVDLLTEWQRAHNDPNPADHVTEEHQDSTHVHPLKRLLLSGVDPSAIPLHIFPTSKLHARAILGDRDPIGAATGDDDDDGLFEEGELDSYMCSEKEQEARLRVWVKEGFDDYKNSPEHRRLAEASAAVRRSQRLKGFATSTAPADAPSIEATEAVQSRSRKAAGNGARSSKVRYSNLPGAVLAQVLGKGVGGDIQVSSTMVL